MDSILSRLIEARVGPVEQAAQCACVEKPPSTRGRTSCSADNVADSELPYNPWYGSYTEHRLQMLSVNDAGYKVCDGLPSGGNSTLTAEPWMLPEQSPSSAEDGAGVTDELETSTAAAVQECQSTPDKKHPAPSSQGFKQLRKVDLNTEQRATTETSRKNSLNDLIEAMLNFQPVIHTQQTSDVLSLQDMKKAHDEDCASESARTAAGVEVELPKTVPNVFKEGSSLPAKSVDDKDVVVAIPNVSIDRSSSPRDFVTDSEVSLFMAGNDAVDPHRLPAERQTRPTSAQLKDPNNEQHPNKQDGGPESQQGLEQRVQENNVDHTSKVVAFLVDKRINNRAPLEKSPTELDLAGTIHADTPAETSKSMTTKQRREEMPNLENIRESENETKPKTAESALPAIVAPVPQQRISVKIILSATSVISNGEEVGHRFNERTAEPDENLKQVDADKSSIRDELKVLRAECVGELRREEKMEVDEDAEHHASEAESEGAEIKSGKCCEEMLTRRTDEVDSDPHHHHHHQQQQQQQQQQCLETQPEGIIMPVTLEEGRGTSSTADESTVIKDTDSLTFLTVAGLAQTAAVNQETTAIPDIGGLQDEITTTNTSPDNHGLSDDVSEPTAEEKTTQRDCVTENVAQHVSDPLGEDVVKFPKSSTGHRESTQKDRRAKRLTKTVRIYHDLSTVIDYYENDREAVTTIRLKSARKN